MALAIDNCDLKACRIEPAKIIIIELEKLDHERLTLSGYVLQFCKISESRINTEITLGAGPAYGSTMGRIEKHWASAASNFLSDRRADSDVPTDEVIHFHIACTSGNFDVVASDFGFHLVQEVPVAADSDSSDASFKR